MRLLKVLGLLAPALALVPIHAQATTLSNGTFADPACAAAYCTVFAPDSSTIANWTVVSGSVDLITTYWQAPPGGGNSIDMDGNAPGEISNTFATIAGVQYVVNFDLSGNPDGCGVKTVQVSAAAASQNFTFDSCTIPNKSNMLWQDPQFFFTADAGLTTLDFKSLDASGPYGAAIGDVTVDPVPEPITVSLFGAGILAAAGLRRRKATHS
jgi:choice-of-anchor C domain-containing protein